MTLTNLEIHWLAEELAELEGCFFEKMQDIEGGYKLKFTAHELIVMLPQRIHLTRYPYPATTPSNLSMYARKHLKSSKVKKVAQEDFDRVLIIELDNGYTIVFELFAKGNLVVVKEGKTVHCLRRETWKDREIKPKRPYRFPQSHSLNPMGITETEFNKMFDQRDIIRSLVKHINMGGKYLEEVCRRASVDKLSEEIGQKEKKKLFQELKKLLEDYKPGIQGEPVVTSLQLEQDFTEKKSFNEALDDYHSPKKPLEHKSFPKLEKRLKLQEESVAKLKEKALNSKQKGDLIYAHLNELQELFAKANQLKRQGKSWEEIGKELGVEINPKTRKVKLQLKN